MGCIKSLVHKELMFHQAMLIHIGSSLLIKSVFSLFFFFWGGGGERGDRVCNKCIRNSNGFRPKFVILIFQFQHAFL